MSSRFPLEPPLIACTLGAEVRNDYVVLPSVTYEAKQLFG